MNGAVGFSVIAGLLVGAMHRLDSTFPSRSPSVSRLGPPRRVEEDERSGRQKERSPLIPLATPTLLHPAHSRPASHLRGFSHTGICRGIFCIPFSFFYPIVCSFVVHFVARERDADTSLSLFLSFFSVFVSRSRAERYRQRKRNSCQGRRNFV